MKKILLAAIAVLLSAPAFAAPEAYNVEVGPQGQLRASPPGSASAQQCCNSASWSQATAPGQQGGAQMMQASDEAQPVKAKKKRAGHKPAPKKEGQPQ